MHKAVQGILFLKNMATGILAPVLTLALLQHGANICTISLFIGLYSATIILAEFPSGIFADLCGRKTSFLLSAVLYVISYALLIVSSGAALLSVSIIINGLGRAFSSGSLDALVIDQSGGHGKSLEWVTSRLAILESAGLAFGALSGGLLAGLGHRYLGNLGVNTFLYIVLFLLAACFVREEKRIHPGVAVPNGFQTVLRQTKASLSFFMRPGIVRALAVFALATGFALNAIETYWQPALNGMQAPYWLFGVVSFGGFGFVICGSWLSERMLSRFGSRAVPLLLTIKALFGGSMMLLSFQKNAFSFVTVYLAVYLFIGSGSVAESTLLNQAAPANHRAGILSLSSLVLQVGGLLAAAGGYLVSTYSRFQNAWLLAGVILLLCAAFFAPMTKRSLQAPAAYGSGRQSSEIS
ncbi:MAG: MFS transporter [Christensenella sp.]|nr:MFS transporter [Christensenella sp.]